jgi:hypothetical protein
MKTWESALKQILIALLSGILILTACGQTPTEDIPTALISTETNTVQRATSAPLPTRTLRERANEPTSTPRPPTPLPTIPTFTPTFDASTIVTVTPALRAECPKENPEIAPDFPKCYPEGSCVVVISDEVLGYLNSGGTLDKVTPVASRSGIEKIIDITGDGVQELIMQSYVTYHVIGCKQEKYEILLQTDPYVFSSELADVVDLNENRIPELIFYSFSRYGFAEVYIIEWDGNKYRSMIDIGIDTFTGKVIDVVPATEYHELIDMNGDGLKEIVIVYNVNELCYGLGGLDFCDGTPAREQITTLGWNGKNYVPLEQKSYSWPQYRFQAIQDGDQQARDGNYVEALSFYQAAIFDDRLEWWSPEREVYEIYTHRAQFDATPTIYPTPKLDISEYPQLAAYAYYRIMLLHLEQGYESDAGTVYKTLEQKFSNNQYGGPYYEMATAFWEAYQSAHKMYDGCAAAIQYAVEHPEILIPLGSDYHGSQSHTYVPADVCPFR